MKDFLRFTNVGGEVYILYMGTKPRKAVNFKTSKDFIKFTRQSTCRQII